jgi:hypothetical protein
LWALIPCPGFNGHKPASSNEGEGQLKISVINKIHVTSIDTHSPVQSGTAPPDEPQRRVLEGVLRSPLEPIDSEPHWGAQGEFVDGLGAIIQQSDCGLGVVNEGTKMNASSHLPAPEMALTPLAAESVTTAQVLPHLSHLPSSGLKPDRRLLWKPPDLKEQGRRSVDVVRLNDNGTSSQYSPGPVMALEPYALFLYSPPLQELRDMASVRPHDKGTEVIGTVGVTTRYGLLHYANLIRRTGPICFLFQPT